jgi:hypothetical protein
LRESWRESWREKIRDIRRKKEHKLDQTSFDVWFRNVGNYDPL